MSSTTMDTLELSDYADRYIVDRLSSLDGVAQVRIGGRQRYAMRVWLDSAAMAARGITANDVESALRAENVELPAGRIERSEEHTSELQSLMRISYAVFCLKKKKKNNNTTKIQS